jgi:hypothetical protein
LNRSAPLSGTEEGINPCIIQCREAAMMLFEPAPEGYNKAEFALSGVAWIALRQQEGGEVVDLISEQSESGLLEMPRG